MTRYDEPPASDGLGGPHPLAGVPQEVLDAVTRELREEGVLDHYYNGEVEAIAHAVLMAGLVELRKTHTVTKCDHSFQCCKVHWTHSDPHRGCILR